MEANLNNTAVDKYADEKTMSGLAPNDARYQESKRKSGEYSDKLDELHLPRETRLLIDRYINEHNTNGPRYGEFAY